MAVRYEIVPVTANHIAELLADPRPADVAEFLAASGEGPDVVLARAVAISPECWAVLADGQVLGIFGVAPISMLSGRGAPWLVGTPILDRYARGFIRLNREFLPRMLAGYSHLENWVDARNTRAINWLRWLGFTVHDPVPFGVAGLPFHRFDMRRE